MAVFGPDNLQMAHLLGAAELQIAMDDSGYAKNKLKLSQFIAIYRIQQILKRGNSARR